MWHGALTLSAAATAWEASLKRVSFDTFGISTLCASTCKVETYPHDPEAFTQGLLWANGSLYESTGLYGRSSIREFQLGPGGGMRKVLPASETSTLATYFALYLQVRFA